ncbi:hypothetical protein C1H46_036548 [Malus baccata]|uniref:Uncharacterized protein n=1 Tax=Malus baccata TaxID=106549 RepID=A0A540KUV1_MALBA|nr:hypothetical protein C1H46_036548 [Malus baccata]
MKNLTWTLRISSPEPATFSRIFAVLYYVLGDFAGQDDGELGGEEDGELGGAIEEVELVSMN